MKIKYEGQFAGKNIITYDKYKNHTLDDLKTYLKPFELCETLKLVGILSNELFTSGNQFIEINNLPITESILVFITQIAIEVSNDDGGKIIEPISLTKACEIYLSIPEYKRTNKERTKESVIRYGLHQFDLGRNLKYLFPRTLLLYDELWQQKNNIIDINSTAIDLFGLTIKEILNLTTHALHSIKSRGFFRIEEKYDENYFENIVSDEIKELILSKEKKLSYIKWLSSGYNEFRNEMNNKYSTDKEYEKYRFNYLITKPIIIPDKNPDMNYIVPSTRLLLEKVTRGLYYDFTLHFEKTSKANNFRQEFGKIFELYILKLLESYKSKNYDLLGEFKYNHDILKSTDATLIFGNKAVLIEAKQSNLKLNSKLFAKIEDIKSDIEKNAGKAITQLWEYEEHIKNQKYKELKDLYSIKEFEKLIILYDSGHFLNSIFKDIVYDVVTNKHKQITKDYYCHIMTIDDFETMLGIDNLNIFEMLSHKRNDKNLFFHDFKDYFANNFANKNHDFLVNKNNDFLRKMFKESVITHE